MPACRVSPVSRHFQFRAADILYRRTLASPVSSRPTIASTVAPEHPQGADVALGLIRINTSLLWGRTHTGCGHARRKLVFVVARSVYPPLP